MTYSLKGKTIWVTGHKGMVGGATIRQLEKEPCQIITADRAQVDLRNQAEVEAFYKANKIDVVIIAAAKVGGILANDRYPADFLYDNLMIEANLIHGAFKAGVEKLLFLGSSCIYPKFAEQPMTENALLTGPLEPTNEWYAVAKIAGIKLCQAYRKQYGADFISAMPTNLYGVGDNFDLKSSHVIPALMRKCIEAKQTGKKEMEIWGTGTVRREFLYVDDCAEGLVFLLKNYSDFSHVNLGTGEDITIKQVAEEIAKIVGFQGRFVYDSSKPDGTPRKLMDVALMRSLGWQAKISLSDGLKKTYDHYLETYC